MRIINDEISLSKLDDLRDVFYSKICPLNKNNKSFNAKYSAGKLEKLTKNNRDPYYEIYNYLFLHKETIYKGIPSELEQFNVDIIDFANRIGLKDFLDNTDCNSKLNSAFITSYETFRNGGTENYVQDWFKTLNLKTCPYCNRNWISSSLDRDGKTNKLYFDIDHFYPKGTFPWLAVSFYNLIPACTICNQREKGERELKSKDHLHPFVEDFDNIVKFEVPINEIDDFVSNKKPIVLNLVPRKPFTSTSDLYKRAINTYNFFNLKNLYDTHLDYVKEILQKEMIYSPEYIKQLSSIENVKTKTKIFQNEDEVKRMIFSNYVLASQIHERPLAKLTKDLLEDFSLRKY